MKPGGIRQLTRRRGHLDPRDWDAFRAIAHRMLDDAIDDLSTVAEGPVWRPVPPAVKDALARSIDGAPHDLEAVYDEYRSNIAPYATGNRHPGFMGWVHGAGTPTGMLAEMLAGALDANLGGRDHAPIYVERAVIAWARERFGFPAEASGLLVTGTSLANLIGVLVARTKALGRDSRRRGLRGEARNLVAYASRAVHGCLHKAMEVSGLGSNALRAIDVDARDRIDLAALRAQIAEDRAAGLHPFLLIGTAGTVDVGAIDDLVSLADVAREEELWFHVDGAFGALAILAPGLRSRLAGIERADSLAFDFHKWAHVPYDAGCILVRDGSLQLETFAAEQDYLRRATRGLAAGDPYFCDLGIDLSRGFRALKVWFTLKELGDQRIGEAIARTCARARELSELVAANPALELLAPVELNIVCFRYRGDGSRGEAALNALNARIVEEIQESGVGAPSTTRIDGKLAIRAAIVNHRTESEDVYALLDAVRERAAALLEA